MHSVIQNGFSLNIFAK